MPKTNADKNIEYLKNLPTHQAPDANKSKINDIIDLYKNKKIQNVKSAANAINLLASKHKSQQKKAFDNYNKLMNPKPKPAKTINYLLELFFP